MVKINCNKHFNEFVLYREELEKTHLKYFEYLSNKGVSVFIKNNKVVIKKDIIPYSVNMDFVNCIIRLGPKNLIEWYENLLGDKIENLVIKDDDETIVKVGLLVFFLVYYSCDMLRLSNIIEFVKVCEKYLPLIKIQVSRL